MLQEHSSAKASAKAACKVGTGMRSFSPDPDISTACEGSTAESRQSSFPR
jgi:hypothetical protein